MPIRNKRRKKLLSQLDELNRRITYIITHSETIIVKQLNAWYKLNPEELKKSINDKKEFYKNYYLKLLYDPIYEETTNMLEKVYKETATTARDMYDIQVSSAVNIEFYNKDGKDFEDRIYTWFNPYSKQYLKKPDEAIRQIEEILNTEANYTKQKIIYTKIKEDGEINELAYFGEIIVSPDDCRGGCADYAGEYPINEIIYPPFHPNCCCEVIYEVTDDGDDAQDLDLEDDIDEEPEEE